LQQSKTKRKKKKKTNNPDFSITKRANSKTRVFEAFKKRPPECLLTVKRKPA